MNPGNKNRWFNSDEVKAAWLAGVKGEEAGHSPLILQPPNQSLIHVLTIAKPPEGKRGEKRGLSTEVVRRIQLSGLVMVDGKDFLTRYISWHSEAVTSKSLNVGEQSLKMLKILYKHQAGNTKATEVAKEQRLVPADPPCFCTEHEFSWSGELHDMFSCVWNKTWSADRG